MTPPRNDITLLSATEVILSRLRWVFFYPAALALLALLGTFLLRPRYKATAAFVAERLATGGRSQPGFAGQYGLNVLTDVNRSPAYYVSVLQSGQLKQQVLESKVTRDSVPLLNLLKIHAARRSDSVALGIIALESMTRIRESPRSGIITVAVETEDPVLSADIAERFIEALQRFNATQRQSQAGERRRFLESRIQVALRGLKDAQENLRRFYQSNPAWTQRPALAVESARLRTTLDGAAELASILQREYELARLEEVADMPVLTIIDRPVPPIRHSWPHRPAIFFEVLILGVLVGAFAALFDAYLARARVQNPETFARLRHSLRFWRR